MKHIIVVGSGIAGLIAAIELSRQHAVTLVTKAVLAESNTRWAQGGIAAAMFSDDSVANHIADTLTAGAGLCNPNAVSVLCTEGPDRIRDLIRLGVTFDHAPDGQFSRGLEAAHSYPRVLHAGGDATGLTIETALVRATRSNPNIFVLEHTFAVDLILTHGAVTGIEVLDIEGLRRTIEADAVILASGGAGQLYLHTTNPSVATGDGVAMALRAGAALADVEFYQFHPTALATPGTFLISEAVRGEGATLLDATGHRFMQELHPSAELAPRDVVARGIARQMAAQQDQPVLLDATGLTQKHGPGFLARRFPSIDAATRSRGLDWSTTPIPVTPAAHYWMGGVQTDLYGRTSVPGLYAVGEVACTGVHGANRLASNSLLESLTFAWRCAHLLLDETASASSSEAFPPSSKPVSLSSEAHPVSSFEGAGLQHRHPHPEPTGALAPEAIPLQPTASPTIPFTRIALQTLLWNNVGIERTRVTLEAAATQLGQWHAAGSTIADLEDRNLLDIARVVTAAAITREESRGAHFRNDFPELSTALQHSLVYRQQAGPQTTDPSPEKVAVSC
ncbi:MAG: L-aspartate oxidase [Acidobacteria bacterium]|nr:L-aspartate oxidase [Acidobacteriota bacterium]